MIMRALRTYFLCVLSIGFISAYGSSGPDGKFEEWGKVTIDELQMKECSFEKNADALLLFDLGEVYYNNMDETAFKKGKFRITTSYYQRFKVFTEKGTRRANYKVTARISSNEEIKNIRGTCYQLGNGQILSTALKAEDIHTTKLSEDENQVSFTVPGVTAGCVFEVGYERIQDVTYTLPKWYFTSDVPSVTSRLSVGFLSCIKYYVNEHPAGDTIIEESEPYFSDIAVPRKYLDTYGRKFLKARAMTYTTHNMRTYHSEPYADAARNYKTWIGFQLKGYDTPFDDGEGYISNFAALSDHLLDYPLFNDNMSKDPIEKKQWSTMLKEDMQPQTKARVIYDYIRNNMIWTRGGGLRPSATNSDLWKNKTGTWTEISLMLIAALRSHDIRAYPMLVGSRYNAGINEDYPILDDYVGIDVFVIFGERDTVILDPTDRNLAFGEPDMAQLNTSGFVLQNPGRHYWHKIADNVESTENISIDAKFDESGKVSGTMRMTYTNHSADYLITSRKGDNQEAISEYIKKEIPNATIESMTDSADVATSTFVCRVRFSAQAVIDNDGNVYMSVPNVYGGSTNPFSNKQRIADVDLIYRNKKTISLQVNIPDGYLVDSVPAPAKLVLKDTQVVFLSSVVSESKTLTWHQALDYHESFFKVSDYPAFFDFQNKYYDIRQRPVTFRKKI